jgi:hypothetical protein
MTDKAAGKRRGRIVRVLSWAYTVERCIAAAMLAAVLVAALVVRAPWRINVVIALLLANVVLSPWRWRLLFDMATVMVLAGVAVWAFRPNNDMGTWEPYSFDEDIARAEAARAMAPQENAAEVYRKLFAAYDADDFDSGLFAADPYQETPTRGWRDGEFPEVKSWLEDHAEGFAMLREATGLPQCRFPLATTQLERDAQMMRTNLAKRWGLVLVRAVNNDLGEGRNAAAMENIAVLRRMAGHLYQQQMLFDMPRGLSLERMAYNAMSRLIVEYGATEEQLGRMEEWLSDVEGTLEADWERVFEYEKLYVKHIAGLFYEINEAGKVRCSRNSILAINEQFKMGLHIVRRMEHAPRVTGLFLWFTIPHRPEYAGRVIDQVFARYFATMSEPGGEDVLRRRAADAELNYKGIIELAAWRAVNWAYPLRQQWQERRACRNATRVLIALKRHQQRSGDWPETLEAVTEVRDSQIAADPINGRRFAYHKNGDGFLLYSTGKNGIDENGRHDPREGSDDSWIWPSMLSMLGASRPDAQQVDGASPTLPLRTE